jgi:hypothetical protein
MSEHVEIERTVSNNVGDLINDPNNEHNEISHTEYAIQRIKDTFFRNIGLRRDKLNINDTSEVIVPITKDASSELDVESNEYSVANISSKYNVVFFSWNRNN